MTPPKDVALPSPVRVQKAPLLTRVIDFLDPLGPLFSVLLLLVMLIAALVHLSGCGGVLPLLPSATIEAVSPASVRPSEDFSVRVRVSPDVSECVMTAFGERTRCEVESGGCRCDRRSPDDVTGLFVVDVNAVTSSGVANAKASVIVDGAPPTFDASRVFAIRNPVGVADALVGEAGSIVDRPFDDVSGATIRVFPTADTDAPALASANVDVDGSFGPLELEGTQMQSPARLFVVVEDAMGNASAATEVVDARDEVGPEIRLDRIRLERTEIGEQDVVELDPGALEKEGGCAVASVSLYRLEQVVDGEAPIASLPALEDDGASVSVGTTSESFSTLVAVGQDKCGNQGRPMMIELGADVDVPTIDLRIIEAKVSSDGSVRVLGGAGAVFDDTSAIRSVEIHINGLFHQAVAPDEAGAFDAVLTDVDADQLENVSFVVVDKVGRKTVRVRLAQFSIAGSGDALDVFLAGAAPLADAWSDGEATSVSVEIPGSQSTLSSIDDVVLTAVGDAPRSGGFATLDLAPAPEGAPIARVFAASAVDERDKSLVIVGGMDSDGFSFSDSWRLKDGGWNAIWADHVRGPSVASGLAAPPARRRGAMAFDPSLQAVVLFGGEGDGDETVYFDDLWTLEDEGWREVEIEHAPPPRAGAALVPNPVDETLMLLGGDCQTGPCDDVWVWDGIDWALHPDCEQAGAVPPGRAGAQVAGDPSTATVVLFGGRRGGVLLDDTWVFDGITWRQIVTPFRPQARAGGAFLFDPVLQFLVLHGGEGSPDEDSRFWAFVDEAWVAVNTSASPPPQRAWGVYASQPKPTIAFGLNSASVFFAPQADVWRGQLQDDGGSFARLRLNLRPPTREGIVGGALRIHGGGASETQDGFAVYALDRQTRRFDLIGLTASTPEAMSTSTFTLDADLVQEENVTLLVESRRASTLANPATLVVDAVEVDWAAQSND